jgi:hypothetical protein
MVLPDGVCATNLAEIYDDAYRTPITAKQKGASMPRRIGKHNKLVEHEKEDGAQRRNLDDQRPLSDRAVVLARISHQELNFVVELRNRGRWH